MKRYLELPLRFVLILSGFMFIFNLPSLLGLDKTSVSINFEIFWVKVKSDFYLLMHANEMDFLGFAKQLNLGESYRYTMTIMLACISIILIFSLVIAIVVLIAPQKVSNSLKWGINFFEAVPDLLIIFFIQFTVITLYKTTGLKFLKLYGVFGAKPYVVPIVTVSFLPLLLLTQFLIKILTEEQTKLYALYGLAKGLSRIRILFIHIIRNVLPLIILQLRTMIWVILSNIYIVEYIFNLPGFTRVFFRGGEIGTLVICLLIFTFPLLLIEAIGWLASKLIRGMEEVSL